MIYFDNAATYFPKSKSVADAAAEAILKYGNAGRSGHAYSLSSSLSVYDCRKKLAELFGTVPEKVIFTSGATEALNIAIKGIVKKGSVTLYSNFEHNSVVRPLYSLARKGVTTPVMFDADLQSNEKTVENFKTAAVSPGYAVITHASNVCGRILPIKELKNARKNTVFIADCSQTAGHIPIDIKTLSADVICIPAHKGLKGPMGVGALIINPNSDILIDPLIEGGTGQLSKSRFMPDSYPERLEAGTLNISGIAAFSKALDEFVYPENEMKIFKYLVKEMRKIKGVTLHGAPENDFSSFVPVVLFNVSGKNPEKVSDMLLESDIAVRSGFHCAPLAHKSLGTYELGGVRISLSENNTLSEADLFLKALSEIAKRS